LHEGNFTSFDAPKQCAAIEFVGMYLLLSEPGTMVYSTIIMRSVDIALFKSGRIDA